MQGETPTEQENEPNSKKKSESLDDYVHLSWYCIRILLFSEFVLLSAMGNMTYMVYAGAAPKKVFCENEYTSNTTQKVNLCSIDGLHRNMDCDIQTEHEFRSVNVEFGYICEETAWVKNSISIQMAGVLIGALFFGHLSDKYGRRRTLLFVFICCAISSFAASFTNNLTTFTILRTIVGFFNGGQTTIFSVYKIEHVPKQHRLWLAALISFAPNFIIMNTLAYFSHDWRTFQRVIVAVSSPALIVAFFLFESPRWLVGRGKIDEAKRIFLEIQRIDKKQKHADGLHKLLEVEYEKQVDRQKKVKNYNVRHLFYTKQMAAATVVFCAGVFCLSMINYGLMFNLEKLSGSIFLNSAYFGVLRWALNSIMGFLDYRYEKCGRKLFHFCAQFTVFLCLSVIATVHIFGKTEDLSQVVRFSTIIATAVCSQVYLSKGITSVEFYPTVVRNTAVSFKSTWSRVGTILAPQLFLVTPWKPVPYIIMTCMSLWDAICFQIVLPETKGRGMIDGLPEKKSKLIKRDQRHKQLLLVDEEKGRQIEST